ncbi:hypothetical protein BDD12DRAFT_852433 [Trichophaea hybrida]|nr:hypothetical protein BDD12DRAFT_852433 [Trichophaea hybrida]
MQHRLEYSNEQQISLNHNTKYATLRIRELNPNLEKPILVPTNHESSTTYWPYLWGSGLQNRSRE